MGGELLSPGSLDFIYMGIKIIQILVLRQKPQGRLLSNAGDSGNIIRRIPHEGFHVNDLGGGNVVLFINCLRRHDGHMGDSLLGQKHRGAAAGKLQGIPVAGHDIYRQLLFIAGR